MSKHPFVKTSFLLFATSLSRSARISSIVRIFGLSIFILLPFLENFISRLQLSQLHCFQQRLKLTEIRNHQVSPGTNQSGAFRVIPSKPAYLIACYADTESTSFPRLPNLNWPIAKSRKLMAGK